MDLINESRGRDPTILGPQLFAGQAQLACDSTSWSGSGGKRENQLLPSPARPKGQIVCHHVNSHREQDECCSHPKEWAMMNPVPPWEGRHIWPAVLLKPRIVHRAGDLMENVLRCAFSLDNASNPEIT